MLHLTGDPRLAVEARQLAARLGQRLLGQVDADRLAGEQPGDRGRLEAALSEPPLGTAHGDPVLCRQVVERRERRDVVRVGMEPADRVGLHHVMEESAPFFDRKPERAGELGIVRRAPGLDEPAHDALKHPVHEERVGHRWASGPRRFTIASRCGSKVVPYAPPSP